MKRFWIPLLVCLLFSTNAISQKIVYVDTEYILESMPEYDEAQEKLNEFTKLWAEDIQTKEKELIDKKAAYQQNEVLMPEVKKIEEQKAIEEADANLSDLKLRRFGTKGDLYKKQQDLIKPIQDRIYNAIKQMAEYRDYDMVLDKATGVSILYVKAKIDVSDEVLRIVNANK